MDRKSIFIKDFAINLILEKIYARVNFFSFYGPHTFQLRKKDCCDIPFLLHLHAKFFHKRTCRFSWNDSGKEVSVCFDFVILPLLLRTTTYEKKQFTLFLNHTLYYAIKSNQLKIAEVFFIITNLFPPNVLYLNFICDNFSFRRDEAVMATITLLNHQLGLKTSIGA